MFNSLEVELFSINDQLFDLQEQQSQSLRRADEYDSYHSTWLAGFALDDWHKAHSNYESLRIRQKEILDTIPRQRSCEILRSVLIKRGDIHLLMKYFPKYYFSQINTEKEDI